MRVIAVNVGTLRPIPWRGKQVQTGIFKHPIDGRIAVQSRGLDGDQQGDLKLHGGIDKAVYVYPKEHYEYWQHEFPDLTFPWGMFGENLTTEGASEDAMYIGNRWRIGSAQFEIVQPREPCFKLGIKFGNPKVIKQFLASGRSGWYLKVITEGEVGAGDQIFPVSQNDQHVTVTDLNKLLFQTVQDQSILQRALQIKTLPTGWHDLISQYLAKHSKCKDSI
jgi:MOSC domain-containing protein YiiM